VDNRFPESHVSPSVASARESPPLVPIPLPLDTPAFRLRYAAAALTGVSTVRAHLDGRASNPGGPYPPLVRTVEPTQIGDNRCSNCDGYHPDLGHKTHWASCPRPWDRTHADRDQAYQAKMRRRHDMQEERAQRRAEGQSARPDQPAIQAWTTGPRVSTSGTRSLRPDPVRGRRATHPAHGETLRGAPPSGSRWHPDPRSNLVIHMVSTLEDADEIQPVEHLAQRRAMTMIAKGVTAELRTGLEEFCESMRHEPIRMHQGAYWLPTNRPVELSLAIWLGLPSTRALVARIHDVSQGTAGGGAEGINWFVERFPLDGPPDEPPDGALRGHVMISLVMMRMNRDRIPAMKAVYYRSQLGVQTTRCVRHLRLSSRFPRPDLDDWEEEGWDAEQLDLKATRILAMTPQWSRPFGGKHIYPWGPTLKRMTRRLVTSAGSAHSQPDGPETWNPEEVRAIERFLPTAIDTDIADLLALLALFQSNEGDRMKSLKLSLDHFAHRLAVHRQVQSDHPTWTHAPASPLLPTERTSESHVVRILRMRAEFMWIVHNLFIDRINDNRAGGRDSRYAEAREAAGKFDETLDGAWDRMSATWDPPLRTWVDDVAAGSVADGVSWDLAVDACRATLGHERANAVGLFRCVIRPDLDPNLTHVTAAFAKCSQTTDGREGAQLGAGEDIATLEGDMQSLGLSVGNCTPPTLHDTDASPQQHVHLLSQTTAQLHVTSEDRPGQARSQPVIIGGRTGAKGVTYTPIPTDSSYRDPCHTPGDESAWVFDSGAAIVGFCDPYGLKHFTTFERPVAIGGIVNQATVMVRQGAELDNVKVLFSTEFTSNCLPHSAIVDAGWQVRYDPTRDLYLVVTASMRELVFARHMLANGQITPHYLCHPRLATACDATNTRPSAPKQHDTSPVHDVHAAQAPRTQPISQQVAIAATTPATPTTVLRHTSGRQADFEPVMGTTSVHPCNEDIRESYRRALDVVESVGTILRATELAKRATAKDDGLPGGQPRDVADTHVQMHQREATPWEPSDCDNLSLHMVFVINREDCETQDPRPISHLTKLRRRSLVIPELHPDSRLRRGLAEFKRKRANDAILTSVSHGVGGPVRSHSYYGTLHHIDKLHRYSAGFFKPRELQPTAMILAIDMRREMTTSILHAVEHLEGTYTRPGPDIDDAEANAWWDCQNSFMVARVHGLSPFWTAPFGGYTPGRSQPCTRHHVVHDRRAAAIIAQWPGPHGSSAPTSIAIASHGPSVTSRAHSAVIGDFVLLSCYPTEVTHNYGIRVGYPPYCSDVGWMFDSGAGDMHWFLTIQH
jgi:hypothetical protein